jgi:hypothetical protein
MDARLRSWISTSIGRSCEWLRSLTLTGVPDEKMCVNNFFSVRYCDCAGAIAVRPYVDPAPALAQSASAHVFYIEPGVQMLRYPDGTGQVYGKVVVDLRSGKVWGFPTGTLDPYPSNPLDSKPTTSKPFALGKFAFDDTEK